jgi:ribonuclease HII
MPCMTLESSFDGPVCGIDEAGRGPWAGPVVAAAVIWQPKRPIPDGLNDSKLVAKPQRQILYDRVHAEAQAIGIGIATVDEIDQLNILGATKLAMQRAYSALGLACVAALIDGNQPPKLSCKTQAVIGGDGISASIAAASIIAKVTRDRMMAEHAETYPVYGFERHVGYGTPEHQRALASHGPCELHRRSFAPIRRLLEEKIA